MCQTAIESALICQYLEFYLKINEWIPNNKAGKNDLLLQWRANSNSGPA